MTPKIVGKTIAKHRKLAKITQKNLASQIRMNVEQVKKIENGRKNIDKDTLHAIESIVGQFHVNSNPTSLKAV